MDNLSLNDIILLIKDIGFPIFVAIYVLLVLTKRIDKLIQLLSTNHSTMMVMCTQLKDLQLQVMIGAKLATFRSYLPQIDAGASVDQTDPQQGATRMVG